MMKTKFKDFIATSPNWLLSTEVNRWLEENPNIHVVKWMSAPSGPYGTRLIIEYEEMTLPKSRPSESTKDYIDDVADVIQVLD